MNRKSKSQLRFFKYKIRFIQSKESKQKQIDAENEKEMEFKPKKSLTCKETRRERAWIVGEEIERENWSDC